MCIRDSALLRRTLPGEDGRVCGTGYSQCGRGLDVYKRQMLTITGIIGGIFFYLIGYGWIGLLGWVLGGILSDVVLKIGGYQKFKVTVLSLSLIHIWRGE